MSATAVTIDEYVSIYFVFASIVSIASATATVKLVVIVCFAPQQYFINNIFVTMASFPPSATGAAAATTTGTQSDNGNGNENCDTQTAQQRNVDQDQQ